VIVGDSHPTFSSPVDTFSGRPSPADTLFGRYTTPDNSLQSISAENPGTAVSSGSLLGLAPSNALYFFLPLVLQQLSGLTQETRK